MKKLLALVIVICLLSQWAVAENMVLKVEKPDDETFELLQDYDPEYDEETGLLILSDVTDPLTVIKLLFAIESETAPEYSWLKAYKDSNELTRPEEKTETGERPQTIISNSGELEKYAFEQAAAAVKEFKLGYADGYAFEPATLEYAMYRAGAMSYTCSIDEINRICCVKNAEYEEMFACENIGSFISKSREAVDFDACVTAEDYAALNAEDAALLRAILDNAGMLMYNIGTLAEYNIVCVDGMLLRPGVMNEIDKQYKVAEEIADGIDKNLGEYEKEKAIHDAVCEKLKRERGRAFYADVFCLAMRKCGLKAEYAVSSVGGEKQVWNRVLLDGKWYYTDVYADDTDNSIMVNTANNKKQECSIIGYAGFNFTANTFDNYQVDERALPDQISAEDPEKSVYTHTFATVIEACDYITKHKGVGTLDFHFIIREEADENAIHDYAAGKQAEWSSSQDARYALSFVKGKGVTYLDIYFRY